MKLWLVVLLPVWLFGCISKSETGSKSERYLYFTSNFPSSVYWEIMVTFENKSSMYWCRDLSMGEGGLVQKVKYEHYLLKKSSDSLKIPLFWQKTNFCGWEMTGLSLKPDGRLIAIHGIYLEAKSHLTDPIKLSKHIPSSLAYLCNPDAEGRYLNCNAENDELDGNFLLPDSANNIFFRIDLKGF